MKKKSKIWVLFLAAAVIFGAAWAKGKDDGVNKKIKQGVVRFHIRANSDSSKDQAEKLQVRDKVVEYLKPYMDRADTKEDARKVLDSKRNDIAEVAKEVLKKNGRDLPVKVYMTREEFPEKDYGSYVFPKGTYDALRIDLGKARGHNWWCVMFPDLCITKESEAAKDGKTKKKLEQQVGKKGVEKLEKKEKKLPWFLQWLEG
ncbi:stage II sporulation protein R [Anaerostipes sp.]|uniref:stage II sporulation protein R n=1 Tax=Anaerostipes sp. TaxID=1872530 RepID=UPI0025BCE436|nr:stage II sporulation protein R [Anaerostipes sp.]MBS7008987.1 stage II sporulation protein R [Anaerostipes sp.]